MIPITYLFTSPDTRNELGKTMTFADIKRGLRRANWRITIPDPKEYAAQTGFTGLTAIYLGHPNPLPGQPPSASAKMITSIRAGHVPEFTILRPDGTIQTKGWRAIFEKVIKAGAASRPQLERVFRINLGTDRAKTPKFCHRCLRAGAWVKAQTGLGLCNLHKEVADDQMRIKDAQLEMRERFPRQYQLIKDEWEKEDGRRRATGTEAG